MFCFIQSSYLTACPVFPPGTWLIRICIAEFVHIPVSLALPWKVGLQSVAFPGFCIPHLPESLWILTNSPCTSPALTGQSPNSLIALLPCPQNISTFSSAHCPQQVHTKAQCAQYPALRPPKLYQCWSLHLKYNSPSLIIRYLMSLKVQFYLYREASANKH